MLRLQLGRAVVASLVALAAASSVVALPVVRKVPGGPFVTQVGPDFFVPAGQTVDWAVRVCNDTGAPLQASVQDYLHSGECPGDAVQELLCPPLTIGGGTLASCDDDASPVVTQPALDVQSIPVPDADCTDVIFQTRVALLAPVGTQACNIAVYVTPLESGQTSPASGAGCSCVQVTAPLPTEMTLGLSVQPDVLPFVAGDSASTAVYEVTGENLTPRDAVGRFVLPLPTGLTFVQTLVCPPGAACSMSAASEFVIDSLVVPEGGTFTASFRVRGDCSGVYETRLCTQGWFEPAEDAGVRLLTDDLREPGETPTCFKPDSPSFVLQKTYRLLDNDASGGPTAGDRVRFLITAWNSGIAPARDVVILDSLPLGYDRSATGPHAAAVDPSGSYAAGQGTWTYPEIGPGTVVSAWIEADMLVDAVAPNRARLSTRVLRECGVQTYLSDNPLTSAPGDATGLTDPGKSSPTVEKSVVLDDADGDGLPSAGDVLHYRLRVRNDGPAAATGVVLTDALPACIGPAGAVTIEPAGAGTNASTASTISVSNIGGADGLQPDEQVIIGFRSSVLSPASCCNQASLSWTGATSPALSGDPRGFIEPEPTCLVGAALYGRLSKRATLVDQDGDGGFSPGDRVRYDVTVAADGSELQDLLVADELPDGVTLDPTTVTLSPIGLADWSFAAPPQGLWGRGRILVTSARLPYAASVTLSFEVALDADREGEVCNRATMLVPSATHPRQSEDADTGGATCFTVTRPLPPALNVALAGSGALLQGCALPGEDVDLTATVSSMGGVAARGVVLEIGGLDDVAVLDAGGGVVAGNTVTWSDIGDLAVGAAAMRTLRGQLSCTPSAPVNATVRADSANAASATAPGVTVAWTGPDVVATLTLTHDDLDGNGTLDAGETLLVEIAFDETAGCDAGDVTAGLAFDSAFLSAAEIRDGGVAVATGAEWVVPGLAAFGSARVAAVLALAPGAADCAVGDVTSSVAWMLSPGTACTDAGLLEDTQPAPPGPCAPAGKDLLREDGVTDLGTALSLLSSLLDASGADDSCMPGVVTRIAPARVIAVDVAAQLDPGVVVAGDALPVGTGAAGQLVFYELTLSCDTVFACKVDADADPTNGRESVRIGVRPCP